ncbi:NADAR family protein [bacterium]|nr:MAG: NADAR family protein [bacterium]QQR62085.1 MAG: NADAR family protein [bacterium]QQR63359.1 MAG: NADAR family protein [bacterium]
MVILLFIVLLLHATLQTAEPEQEIYKQFQAIITQLNPDDKIEADKTGYKAYQTYQFYNPNATSWKQFQNRIEFYEKPDGYNSFEIQRGDQEIGTFRTTDQNQHYYEFTNFWEESFQLPKGESWKTVENYFQAQKVLKYILPYYPENWSQTITVYFQLDNGDKKNRTETVTTEEQVTYFLKNAIPIEAFNLARQFKHHESEQAKNKFASWHQEKYTHMINAIWAKFNQNNQLKNLLMSTHPKILVENAGEKDKEWGAGADFKGNNFLGIILMLVREQLKKEKPNGQLKTFNNPAIENYLVYNAPAKDNNNTLITQLGLNLSKMDYSKHINTENFNTIFPADNFTQKIMINNETYNGIEYYLKRTYSNLYEGGTAKKKYKLFLWQMRLQILLTVNQTIKQNLLKSENKTILFTNNNNLNDDFFGVNQTTMMGFNHVGMIAMKLRAQLLKTGKTNKPLSITTQLVTPVTKTKIKNENSNAHSTLTRTPQAEFPPKSTPTIKHNSFINWLLGFDWFKSLWSWLGYS